MFYTLLGLVGWGAVLGASGRTRTSLIPGRTGTSALPGEKTKSFEQKKLPREPSGS